MASEGPPRTEAILLSLSRLMVHEASEARRPRVGWCTVHGPAVPLAFLEITNVTVDEVHTLSPPVRPCCKLRWHAAAPFIMSGCPSHAATGG